MIVSQNFLIKIRHSKFILKKICQLKGIPITIKMDISSDGKEYEFYATCGNQVSEMRISKADRSHVSVEQDVGLALCIKRVSKHVCINQRKSNLSKGCLHQ